MKKIEISQSVIERLQDDEVVARLFLEIKQECNTLDTLKRWIKTNDIKLTYYSVLDAISEILGVEIHNLVEEK